MEEKTDIKESKNPEEQQFTVIRGKISAELMQQIESAGNAELMLKVKGFEKLIDGSKKAQKQEETVVAIRYDFRCSPLDGILAINNALREVFGYTEPLKEGFFGMNPPTRLSIKTGYDSETPAFAGMLAPPAWEGGYIAMHPMRPMALHVLGEVKKKFEPSINNIMANAKKRVKTESIYRGKAVELDMNYLSALAKGREFDPIACAPTFMNLSNLEDLILPRDIESELETEILAVIQHADHFRKNDIPLSYGCIFTGPKGTGKTLTASHIAKVCMESGFSFFFLKTPAYWIDAFDVAQFYGPSVLFCEDAESIFGGPRTPMMNAMLEKMDGVGSKGNEVMSLFTSNNPELINEYFLRGRRLGNEIKYRTSDAESAARFIERNAKEYLAPDIELDRVGVAFNGLVPADITEGIIKAKKAAVHQFGADIKGKVTTEMLVVKGEVMRRMRGLQSRITIPQDSLNLSIVRVGEAIKGGVDVPMEAWQVFASYFQQRDPGDDGRPPQEKEAKRPASLAESTSKK